MNFYFNVLMNKIINVRPEGKGPVNANNIL